MVSYNFILKDRTYRSWEITDVNDTKVILDIQPFEAKLFANDTFIIEKHTTISILQSPIRCATPIPGVLVLTGNKTYGRQNNAKTPHKLLYKCIPDDIRLPPFLIPYEVKNMGFSKNLQNVYVTFTFDNWQDKHPRGKLDNVIGTVDMLGNFYEYQLFCKKSNISMNKFQKETICAVKNKTDNIVEDMKCKYPSIQDRTDWYIITIDPENSLDFDDGFSIVEGDDGEQQISVYISNVTIWLDFLELWKSFTKRVSTIYLPDKKRPMLPPILSDGLCSLQEKETRIAFVMDIIIKKDEIIDIKYANCFIKVAKNYVYEEPKLLANPKYQKLLDVTRRISLNHKYIENIADSHDMVCYLMIFMNYHCAKELLHYKSGIFRSTIMKRDFSVPDTIPRDVGKQITLMNSVSGQYIDGAQIESTRHEILDLDAYIHITSPIRRIVDVLNMIKIQQVMGMDRISENAYTFYDQWINDIDYINTTTRSIRKVQNECTLLDLCSHRPDLMEKEYDGYVTDKNTKDDTQFQYNVFLPELKLSAMITVNEDLEIFDNKKFKLFLFNNEEKFKRKIRLHMV